ncbi:MAG TPA: EAL domain-containing protein [Woeseiaceae bacterium]|nr:EAL domain-containing protein [Woeseiaceae bacterium]
MAGHSILYFGSDEFAAAYLARLEGLACCGTLTRTAEFSPPADVDGIELVLFEAGSVSLRPARKLREFIHAMRAYPLVALTSREKEQQGIAAVRMGAEGYLCIDDAANGAHIREWKEVLDHALRRHRLQAQLSGTNGTVLSILKSINDGVIVVDRRGHVLEINPAARFILGLGPRQYPPERWGQSFCNVAADGKTPIVEAELPLVKARKGEKFSNQVAVYRPAGSEPGRSDVILSINGQGLYDGARSLAGGVITFRDVTNVVRRTVELEKRAQYDDLTLLPNRGLFVRQLEKALGRSRRNGKHVAVLFIDLDRFKSVNDTLGHDVGDELLRQVGERLARHLRIGDFPGRWGGDEFVACLEDLGEPQNAAAAAQKLLLVLSERYVVKSSEVYATPSIGIAIYPESGDDAERLVKAADLAMYQAKTRGGGRFQFFSEALNSQLEQREEFELGLRHALVRNEFVLHYQPRIEVGSGRLIGLEALLRWQHPSFGLLPPARFLPILESSGLIHSAGEWVIDTACRQLAAWQHQYELPDLAMAINLSPQQLMRGRLVEAVTRSLANTSLDAGCIEVEISNGDLVRSRSSELKTLQGLRALGVRLSLDHFGTHDVSFRSLDDGVIDSFILDQALIQDVVENGSHQRIIRAAIAMARGLDIEVAAEGVETIPQLEFLKDCDCDLAQGFLIGRPMQAEKVSAILRSEIAGTRLLSQRSV